MSYNSAIEPADFKSVRLWPWLLLVIITGLPAWAHVFRTVPPVELFPILAVAAVVGVLIARSFAKRPPRDLLPAPDDSPTDIVWKSLQSQVKIFVGISIGGFVVAFLGMLTRSFLENAKYIILVAAGYWLFISLGNAAYLIVQRHRHS